MPALQLTDKFFPGLGPGGQHVIGATNLGVSIVDATLSANTARTDAQLIASPPNTSSALAVGPVVHSLQVPPSFVIVQSIGSSLGPINPRVVTYDNSAVYIDVRTDTATALGLAGVRVRVIAVR